LSEVPVGTLLLELCTPRAGELDVLAELPREVRVGVGVVDQKQERVEPVAEIAARARRAIALFGAERVLLTPDCGFATFADTPIASAEVAEGKLRALVEAAAMVRRG
jgi:5-methyltetrahydropteroyltriglutamate--homocysteine methyltransferase